MEKLTLIANSGIQFSSFEIEINPNDDVIKSMGFHECLDDNFFMTVEYACFLPNDDIWVSKKSLKKEGYIDSNNVLKDDINRNTLTALSEDKEYYTVNDFQDALEYYENKWLPLPFFRKGESGNFSFGPTTWVRGLFKDITPEGSRKTKKYKVILAFDTNIAKENAAYFTPKYSDISSGNNYFSLCANEDHNINFCNREYDGDWVDSYLEQQYYLEGRIPSAFPRTKHLGAYLYLVKYLANLKNNNSNVFPEIVFYADNEKAVDVDLVLDIGNANTCGLLFESPSENVHFEFDKVQKLKLNDLSLDIKDFTKNQDTSYNNPFDMRLVFSKARFGEIINHHYQKSFEWPSLVRVGKEAKRLINLGKLNSGLQEETATSNSSPKRYLWDDNPAKIPWEFINLPRTVHKDSEEKEKTNFNEARFAAKVYYEGISNQFKGDGKFTTDKNFGVIPQYSRKSLMVFVFIEIYLHALAQINSHEFRSYHGSISKPRKLRRITITCPTSIVQEEQVILRECAMDAAKAIFHFYTSNYDINKASNAEIEFEIIPNPKDLAKNLGELDTKKHWIYDEATCCQLVYLYSEISMRYLNDTKLFFDLYGKKRNYVQDGKEEYFGEKSLTVGSIDIGGGTTDLMICSYHYTKNQTDAVIEPRPLFWDSFNFAGDELLKKLVQYIVLEVPKGDSFEEGCTGMIETYARECNCGDVTSKMLNFFGPNTANQSYQQRVNRKNFIIQFAIPVALKYLEHARQEKADKTVGFEEIFADSKPNEDLLNNFNKLMNAGGGTFEVKKIKWKLSTKRVFNVLETTFAPLLKQLSILLSAYNCDIVLLAGKPTTLSKFRELMISYYPVSPDRIISLNNYRIGRWYPYADERGCFEDPKTIVSVGALVGLMGERNKLKNFRLNTEHLRTKLISTCDYVGALNNNTMDIDNEILSLDLNKKEVVVDSIPLSIGYKQINNKKYLGRPIYALTFNYEKIREKVISTYPDLENANDIDAAVIKYKDNLEKRMPFKVTFKRTMSKSKEEILIDKIKDANSNELSSNFLTLDLKTLSEDSYWLDQGIFILKNK